MKLSKAYAARHCGLCFSFSLAIAISIVLVGCSSPTSSNSNTWNLNPDWRTHSVYSAPAPHASLFVEVDCVEGMEPRAETLAALRTFLDTYCDKPGGIRIEQGLPIPRNIARGYFRQELALKFMDGPSSSNGGGVPAYMYILLYDSSLEPRSMPAFITRTAAAMPASSNWRSYNGHVEYLPYPAAVFIHGRARGEDIDRGLLLHEVGHLLGPRPGQKYHCDSKECLMYPELIYSIHSSLLFRNRIYNTNLCDGCHSGLLQARTNEPPKHLRFRGPWLTRQQTNYAVWSLPKVAVIVPDSPADDELPGLLQSIKTLALDACAPVKTNREGVIITGTWWNDKTRFATYTALTNATQDWYRPIRERAREELRNRPTASPPSDR